MKTQSKKYPKLIAVEWHEGQFRRAVTQRDCEGTRWTKQVLHEQRKLFTKFCEHVADRAIACNSSPGSLGEWLDHNLAELAATWDTWQGITCDIANGHVAIRGRIDINGQSTYYVTFSANISISALKDLIERENR